MCQYKTCWQQLNDFKIITEKLREIYSNNAVLVEMRNLGSYLYPDLYLTRSSMNAPASAYLPTTYGNLLGDINSRKTNLDRVQPKEYAFLYESHDYCNAQPMSGLPGITGRQCSRTQDNLDKTGKDTSSKATIIYQATNFSSLGTCGHLCCDRGFYSKLVFDIVECNCRFRFCCRIDCDSCLRQRMLHYCR